MNAIKIGVAAIIENDSKILFGKRMSSHGEGTWGLIGGHLEHGETFEQCIRREVMEESGLELKNISFAELTEDFFSADKHYISIYMKADIVDISLLTLREPDKISEWGWFDKDGLPENMFLPINNLIKKGYRF